MEFLVLRDLLENKDMHLPSEGYPALPRTNDCEGFCILDDDGGVYFTGFIYNSSTAYEDDFEEIQAFMDSVGATKLMIKGEVILG